MNLERFVIKFPARSGSQLKDEADLIPILHEWIRLKKLEGTLIDVADYRHVPEGPGVMLISHEINYALDHTGGQWGLSAQRKLGREGIQEPSHVDRIVNLIRATARFGVLLEADQRIKDQFHLSGEQFYYRSNDRLHGPNTDEAFAQLKSDLEVVAKTVYPDKSVSITRIQELEGDPLTAWVRVDESIPITTLAPI